MRETLKVVFPLMILFGCLFLSSGKPKGPLTVGYEVVLVVGGILGMILLRYNRPGGLVADVDQASNDTVPPGNKDNPDSSKPVQAETGLITRSFKFLSGMVIRFLMIVALFALALLLAGLMTAWRAQR